MKNLRNMIYGTGLAVSLLVGGPAAQSADLSSYELGLAAVDSYRYSEALMHFQRAAERGEPDAQRNLGLMLLYGDLLYGKEVPRNQERAKRLLQLAAAHGCEVSSFMVKVMAQHGH